MVSLRGIVAGIKGHDCEHNVRKTIHEFSISGAGIEGGPLKFNLGMFSSKVIELVKATDTAVSLDDTQYRLCRTVYSTKDEQLRSMCERIRLQVILSFNMLRPLLEQVKLDPKSELRKQLAEWIDYSADLHKHVIKAIDPTAVGKGLLPKYSLGDITKYQKISEEDLKNALAVLE